MEKTKLRTKAMNILQEHLAEEEFARIQSVMIGDNMEALDIIANFSKPEAMAFILLKDNRDWGN